MPHVENTSVLYEWLKETRLILQDVRTHFHGLAYTPLAILWESDPYILKCTVSNLLYALVAIVLVSAFLDRPASGRLTAATRIAYERRFGTVTQYRTLTPICSVPHSTQSEICRVHPEELVTATCKSTPCGYWYG